MKILFLLLAMTQILHAYGSHDLNGTWIQDDLMTVEVSLNSTDLLIQQCSQMFTTGQDKCFSFNYRIHEEQIYSGDRKVGDVYPYSLLVYDSNSQVTEMLKLELRTLEYTYSYSNMDGDAFFQKARLNKSK